MSTPERIVTKYKEVYQTTPRLFRSPGRINLIGEHTDYNEGFVLPASVDKAVYFAVEVRNDNQVELFAADLDNQYHFSLENLSKPEMEWPLFQLGVLDQLRKEGIQISGFQAVFGGDIPSGAGLSSSAALECCLLFALNELFQLGLSRMEIARMAQKAENEFVGVNCGIMDQFASVFGQPDSVIRLDCKSMEYAYFPFEPAGHSLVLCDTTVKHSLANSEYNTRRLECEQGVAVLQRYNPAIKSLRDATMVEIELHRNEMEDNVYRRCRFMVGEIARVGQACELLMQSNTAGLGEKMYETHDGLRYDYEVSCDELDFLVDFTRTLPGVAGARMMGGGFGGCTLNLVEDHELFFFEEKIKDAYRLAFKKELPCYRVKIGTGTEEIQDITCKDID